MIEPQPRGPSLAISNSNLQKRQYIENLSSGSRLNISLKACGILSKNRRVWDSGIVDPSVWVGEKICPVGGSAAFARTLHPKTDSDDLKAVVVTMSSDLSDFTAPHTQHQSAIEPVYIYKMAYFGDLIGGDLHMFDACFEEGFLHRKTIDVEITSGIRHRTMRESDQFQDPFPDASTSGINSNVGSYSSGFIYNDDYLNNFTSVTGCRVFVTLLKDSGSFTANSSVSSAGSNIFRNLIDEKNAELIVSDANEASQGKYGHSTTFFYSCSGDTFFLTLVPPVPCWDMATYNFSAIQSVTQIHDCLGILVPSITEKGFIPGTIMELIQYDLEMALTGTIFPHQSIAVTHDPSFGGDARSITKGTWILNFSLSMRPKGQQASASRVNNTLLTNLQGSNSHFG